MSLWVDKHRPTDINKLDYHVEQAKKLNQLISMGDFPHLLVFGPSGAGKKTRIHCLLRELYGAGVDKVRIEHQTFQTPSNKKIEINTIASNYHIEVNPSDVGIYDRIVVQELLKSVAQTHQLDVATQKDFKVVIINETDRLTKDAQHGLRRTMEKYMRSCRVVLCCNSTSRVIPAIRSRCLCVRIAAPSNEEISTILQKTCRKEGLELPVVLADRISQHSNRNLRRALLMCEVCRVKQYPFSEDQELVGLDWEVFLKQTATLIIQQQTPKRVSEVRTRLYDLMTHLIPADVIIKGLLDELLISCDGQIKHQVISAASVYEHRLQLGQKAIYHIEAFIIKFMAMYKKFMEDGVLGGFGGDGEDFLGDDDF